LILDQLESKSLQELKRQCVETWGTEFKRIRAIVCELTHGDWYTVADLIQKHAISHKTVSYLITLFDPWLDFKKSRLRFKAQYVDAISSVFDCASISAKFPSDPYETAAKSSKALLESVTSILRGLPQENFNLDQVGATPLTCVKRALFLAQNYDPAETSILFLGDHDMTSLALAHLYPELKAAVVDVDERLLDYVNTFSMRNGFSIRTVFADLRVELPRSLREQFDLVFSDPPYTPAGMRLFLRRGLGSLKRSHFARILFCYGFSERHPMLGFKVQNEIFKLRLVTEAIWPHFNRYTRAQAIGCSSALYVCRPTRKTWAAISRPFDIAPRIYTHGKSSEESSTGVAPAELLDRVRRYEEGDWDGFTLVGEGWPEKLSDRYTVISIRRYIVDMLERLGKPPFTKPPHTGLVAVNLYPHYGAYLIRVLMASEAERLLIATTEESLRKSGIGDATGSPLRALVESKYHLSTHILDAHKRIVFITAKLLPRESDPLSYVLRYLVDHRQALVCNAWREALISWFGRKSRKITKNQARGVIKKGMIYKLHAESYLSELPLSTLKTLVTEVEHTLAELDG
jgi:hypothetical protein